MLDDRTERNRLRHTVIKAENKKVIGKEEVGFIVTLVDRFRGDIEKKIKQLHVIQGEIAQLRANEQVIINLVQNLINAAERDQARQETAQKLRDAREEEMERHRARAKKLPKEQADTAEETLKELKEKEDKKEEESKEENK